MGSATAPMPSANSSPAASGKVEPVLPDTVSVYIHWPWCRSKCAYCDFNSYAGRTPDQARWRAAYLRDLDYWAARLPGRRVETVFFGGGTPSLMDPGTVAALVGDIGRHWTLAPEAEITLEANPTSAEAARFSAFRAAGVNRLSLGVQSLDESALEWLGRTHSAAQARVALEQARACFPRVSCDLIYARPGQTPEGWRAELAAALALGCDHLSLYTLILEEGTALFTRWQAGQFAAPDEDSAARQWDITQEDTAAAGLPAYEISNHARPGAECRHNLVYWRGGDWVGLGPGAHGRLTLASPSGRIAPNRIALSAPEDPMAWLAQVEAGGHAGAEAETLTSRAWLTELLLMGLRLSEGLPRACFHDSFGAGPEALLPAAALDKLCRHGFLECDTMGLRATAAGRQRLDALLTQLCV